MIGGTTKTTSAVLATEDRLCWVVIGMVVAEEDDLVAMSNEYLARGFGDCRRE